MVFPYKLESMYTSLERALLVQHKRPGTEGQMHVIVPRNSMAPRATGQDMGPSSGDGVV